MAQKTLIQIVQAVSAELNLPQPVVARASTDENTVKLVAFIRAVCDDLLSEHEWQMLNQRYVFTTVDGVDSYNFPTDIQRFISGTFFDTSNRWPITGSITPMQWESRLVSNVTSPFPEFRIKQDKIFFSPTPGATPYTFVFEYVSNSYVRDVSTGVAKADFGSDSDICLFDHRVVIYGTKLKWRDSIGQDTTGATIDYVRSLEFAKGSDVPSQPLSLIGGCSVPMISTSNYPEGNWVV
ncbi:MAG: hypothetical protein V5B36_00895 [Candidatus Accumulibacter sp. UW25]|jgi:hypothetical protein